MKYQHALVISLIIVLSVSYFAGYTPILLGIGYGVLSVMTYYLYAKDKKSAQNNQWRISENTLHISALLGGWPGALIAQNRLRHKTQKVKFRMVFGLTLLMNISLLIWMHTEQGSQLIQTMLNHYHAWIVTNWNENPTALQLLQLTHLRPKLF